MLGESSIEKRGVETLRLVGELYLKEGMLIYVSLASCLGHCVRALRLGITGPILAGGIHGKTV